MKRISIFYKLLLCVFSISSFTAAQAQADVVNGTLLSTDSNTLYIGISNAVKIINSKNPFFEIRAAQSALSATTNPFVFDVRPTRMGWDTIFVYDGNKVILQKAFKIAHLPPVEARLGTLRVDEATQEEIYINGWLVLMIPNCTCTTSYVVTSFEVDFETEVEGAELIKIEGDRLTTKARKTIKSLKPGDVVYFDHIIAKNQDGETREIPGFSIAVKE